MSVATGSHTRWLEEREWAPPPPARPIRIVGGVVEELDEVELEPEPEPEPAVEFSLAPGDQARVAARAGVVFRSGAEMDSEQLGILEHGEVIDVREVRPLDVSQGNGSAFDSADASVYQTAWKKSLAGRAREKDAMAHSWRKFLRWLWTTKRAR